MTLFPTPSQTVGPFWAIALPWAAGPDLDPAGILVAGTLFDGAGTPISDGLLELWDPSRRAFGACGTSADGRFHFTAARPTGVEAGAPHWGLGVFARGLLCRIATRVYLPDEPTNLTDPVLAAIADPTIRATLIAATDGPGLRFDVHLQGPHETAFLAWD